MRTIRENFEAIQRQLLQTIEALPTPDPPENVGFFYFLPKAYMLGRGIGLLCESGGATEARILLRSLADHLIEFRFILGDLENRMRQFARFTPIESMRRLQAFRKCNIWGRPPEFFDELEAQLQADYDEVSDDYRTKKGKPQRTWHGKTTFALAESLGPDLETLYELLYRDTSSSVHPSNLDSRHYVAQDDARGVHAIVDPESARRTRPSWVLPLTAKLNLDFAASADDRFGLANGVRIAELDAELMQLLKQSSDPSERLDAQT